MSWSPASRKSAVMDVEGLYVVHFGVPGFYGSGVVVLETERLFGGDGMYYYVGDYKVDGGRIAGKAMIALHTPILNWATIFGDSATRFDVVLDGVIGKGTIIGHMTRAGFPAVPITLEYREKLP
jgi:hypothetical protein